MRGKELYYPVFNLLSRGSSFTKSISEPPFPFILAREGRGLYLI